MDTVLAIEDGVVPFPMRDLWPGTDRGTAGKVLVADDDPVILSFVAVLLEDEGYAVRRALDGQQALERLAREPADVVVADVMMPRIDGVTLTAKLRERGDHTPVVLTSAVYAAVDIPGIRFVPKPFDLDHLVAVVSRVRAEARVAFGEAGPGTPRGGEDGRT